jgi:hypothetical protein
MITLSLITRLYCLCLRAIKWSLSILQMVWFVRLEPVGQNQKLNIIQRCVHLLIPRKNVFFLIIKLKLIFLFSDRQAIVATLNEMVDGLIEELLQPVQNELIPKSD